MKAGGCAFACNIMCCMLWLSILAQSVALLDSIYCSKTQTNCKLDQHTAQLTLPASHTQDVQSCHCLLQNGAELCLFSFLMLANTSCCVLRARTLAVFMHILCRCLPGSSSCFMLWQHAQSTRVMHACPQRLQASGNNSCKQADVSFLALCMPKLHRVWCSRSAV